MEKPHTCRLCGQEFNPEELICPQCGLAIKPEELKKLRKLK